MTISIEFADGEGGRTEGTDVATNRGWAEFGAWVDSLPLEGHEALVHFWEQGYTFKVKPLAEQIRKASAAEGVSPNVRSVALNVAALCEAHAAAHPGPDADGVFVSDGTD